MTLFFGQIVSSCSFLSGSWQIASEVDWFAEREFCSLFLSIEKKKRRIKHGFYTRLTPAVAQIFKCFIVLVNALWALNTISIST